MRTQRIVIFSFLVGLLASCASGPPPQRTIPSLSREDVHGPNESEVLVQNTSSLINGLLDIFIDGELVAQVDKNSSERVIIPNGNHSIRVQTAGGGSKTNTVEFTANSKRISFKTSSIYLYFAVVFRLSKESETDLGTGRTSGVVGALARAAQETLKNAPAKSRIAIVYITAQDRNTTDYVVGELEYIWVNDGYFITDRSQLDRLRREQNFGMSEEVDDATAARIGKIAGASIIVTGRVDGEGSLRRLRLRALDANTAQVVGAASERL
ncbi:hypothetical protein FACS1894172_13460 [Spirochaetia bacterium]|nr:hypothetical protein FACS1894164_21070 [Spirochaetia bacterium]GHU33932.1 hypothetical protein FACS1894172_13460 [Spirochaetia bacterium]